MVIDGQFVGPWLSQWALPKSRGRTPLHKAAKEGHEEPLNLLIENGASVKAKKELRGEGLGECVSCAKDLSKFHFYII